MNVHATSGEQVKNVSRDSSVLGNENAGVLVIPSPYHGVLHIRCYSVGFVGLQGLQPAGRYPQTAARAEAKKAPKKKAKAHMGEFFSLPGALWRLRGWMHVVVIARVKNNPKHPR